MAIDIESCCDRVKVYDGLNNAAPLLGTFTGGTLPNAIFSTNNYMYVTFETDGSVTHTGFRINYTAGDPRKYHVFVLG